jgi:hypothetical protein
MSAFPREKQERQRNQQNLREVIGIAQVAGAAQPIELASEFVVNEKALNENKHVATKPQIISAQGLYNHCET